MSSRPIQAATAGLLSLLQLKNRGENPSTLEAEVRPTVDMTPWWLRGESVHVYDTAAAALAVEGWDIVEAGTSEWVYIHVAYGEATSAAGTPNTNLVLLTQPPGITQVVYSTPIVPSVTYAGSEYSSSSIRDLWVPPGFRLRFSGADLTVGDAIGFGAVLTRVHI